MFKIMKSISIVLLTCFFFSINASSQDFKKLNDSDAYAKQIEQAKKFAIAYFNSLKNGSYYQFKEDEATEAMKSGLTEEKQKTVYHQLKDNFGDLKSLVYTETWVQNGDTGIKIFRFKSDFDKSSQKLEIRVVFDNTDKIAGFFIKPWSDPLN